MSTKFDSSVTFEDDVKYMIILEIKSYVSIFKINHSSLVKKVHYTLEKTVMFTGKFFNHNGLYSAVHKKSHKKKLENIS